MKRKFLVLTLIATIIGTQAIAQLKLKAVEKEFQGHYFIYSTSSDNGMTWTDSESDYCTIAKDTIKFTYTEGEPIKFTEIIANTVDGIHWNVLTFTNEEKQESVAISKWSATIYKLVYFKDGKESFRCQVRKK